jgi:hypothetical protein
MSSLCTSVVSEPSSAHPGKVDTYSDVNSNAIPRLSGIKAGPTYAPIIKRDIEIEITRHRELLAFLHVDVDPLNFPVSKTVRYHYWADEIVEQDIVLPQSTSFLPSQQTNNYIQTSQIASNSGNASSSTALAYQQAQFPTTTEDRHANTANAQANLHVQAAARILRVHCSLDDVNFEFLENKQNGEQRIRFKFTGEKFPNISRFYFCLFTDAHRCNLVGVYEVFVHAHLHATLDTVRVGQLTPGKLYIPAIGRARRVRCYSSNAKEVLFHSKHAFELEPHTVNQLSFKYRTMSDGKRSVLVHMVDDDTHELIQSWILYANAIFPNITNRYKVRMRIGQGSRKNFDFVNKYKRERRFLFDSSDPDAFEIMSKQLHLGAGGQGNIRINIHPRSVPGSDTVYVFVVDEQGRTEECLQFVLEFVARLV